MARYQIRITDRSGCGIFEYFEADTIDEAKEISVDVSNAFLWKRRIYDTSTWWTKYKPIQTINVVELKEIKLRDEELITKYETVHPKIKWVTKRGGNKFKLHLSFIEVTFKDGVKKRDEWYTL